MRQWRSNRRGLSEVVGALMLVLIVVAAATSLSIFAATYQKQLQSERSLAQQKGLESLDVLRITPALNASRAVYASLNITVTSLYIDPSVVTSVRINDNPLAQYTAYALNVSTGRFAWTTVGPGGELTLSPREQVNLLVNTTPGSPDFYNASFVLPSTDYLKVEVLTALENDFARVFLPPTAVALVTTLETFSGANFTVVPELDGSASFQPGNATIVDWSWLVTPGNLTADGAKAAAPFLTAPGSHQIRLTVTSSDGLEAVDSIVYP